LLDSPTLRETLKIIYGIEDKYLVKLDSGWYVPTYDKNDKVGTWIGYRILSVRPNLRTAYTGSSYVKSVKIRFRLSFIGPQAEELALATLLFDDRKDVVEAFAKSQTQLNYISREILTYPIKEGGLNDSLCWFVDIDCQSFYAADVNYEDWKVSTSPPADPSWIKTKTTEDMGGSLSIKI
jgi:hypothetical protein